MILPHAGRRLLNLPWGAVALLDVAIPLSPVLYHHDRLRPRAELLSLMPELRRLLLGAFLRYWTRDYWQRYLAGDDPLRRLSWTMLREIAYRFTSGVMDVKVGDAYQQWLRRRSDVSLGVVGHSHEPLWQSFGHRKLLGTGCIRNEYGLVNGGREQPLLPKVYAEVELNEGRCVRSQLVEVAAPPPVGDYVPDDIFAVIEPLRELLASRNLLAASRGRRDHVTGDATRRTFRRLAGAPGRVAPGPVAA
jgi:hypothetical protein